jgi:hypothetical protein
MLNGSYEAEVIVREGARGKSLAVYRFAMRWIVATT